MTQFEKFYRVWFADKVEPEFRVESLKKWFTVDEIIAAQRVEIMREAKRLGLKLEDISQPTGRITQVAFLDTEKDAEQIIFYMKKYDQLKEVIENMIARLDEGSEMTLTKDSIIVLALKEAIK